MLGTTIELILICLAHAVVGIYSTTLKNSKKLTCIIWGAWIALQSALFFYVEVALINSPLKFFFGFIFPLVGQYVLFFVTTKGKFTKRIFIILTYSIFFCIITPPFIWVKSLLSELHWSLTVLIQATLLSAIIIYFLCFVCPLCHKASKNITRGWIPLIFVNIVFIMRRIRIEISLCHNAGISPAGYFFDREFKMIPSRLYCADLQERKSV